MARSKSAGNTGPGSTRCGSGSRGTWRRSRISTHGIGSGRRGGRRWRRLRPPGTLHAKHEIETAAALRLDRQPVGYGRFEDKYEKRGRRWFVFETRWRDETGLIIGRSIATMAFPREQGTGNRVRKKEGGARREEDSSERVN